MFLNVQNFKNLFRKIIIWLNVLPHFDENYETVKSCRTCKLNAAIKLIILSLVSFFSFTTHFMAYKRWGFSAALLFALEYFLTFACLVTGTIKTAFGDYHKWTNYFENKKKIKQTIANMDPNLKKSNKLLFIGLTVYTAMTLVIFTDNLRGWMGLLNYFFRVCHIICDLYGLFLLMLYGCEIVEIKRIYSDIKKLLSRCENTEEITNLWLNTFAVVKNMNQLFGWQLFFAFLNLLMYLLHGINTIMLEILITYKASLEVDLRQMLLMTSTVFFLLIAPLFVTIACDLTEKHAQQATYLCSKLKGKFPNESQLNQLYEIMQERQPIFTAAGIFRLDRSLYFDSFCCALSHFLVLIPFNLSEHKYTVKRRE